MLILKINDIKKFTNQLLIGNMFDSFSLVEASITTFSHFSINGELHPDFFDTDTAAAYNSMDSAYCLWKELKSYCFSIIRGKLPPLQFRITFQLSPKQYDHLFSNTEHPVFHDSIRGFNLNIQYRNHELICTAGISADTFIFDKTPELIWNSSIEEYFRIYQLDFDKM